MNTFFGYKKPNFSVETVDSVSKYIGKEEIRICVVIRRGSFNKLLDVKNRLEMLAIDKKVKFEDKCGVISLGRTKVYIRMANDFDDFWKSTAGDQFNLTLVDSNINVKDAANIILMSRIREYR